MTAMHYFDRFPTWRKFAVMRAVFRVCLIIVCTTFAGLFSATILDLESSGIVKYGFGVEVLTFRAYHGKF